MAQLSLFASTSTRRPSASQAVPDAAGRRTHPYRVPIYHVTLVRETAIAAPVPRLCGAEQAAELLRQYLGAVDREHLCAA